MEEINTIEEALRNDLDDLNDSETENNEMEIDNETNINPIKSIDSSSISRLSTSGTYLEHMKKIEEHVNLIVTQIKKNDEEYKLIVTSNSLISEITDELLSIQKFVIDSFSKQFPGLENTIANTLDYLRVVDRIGNNMNITQIKLDDILSASQIMVVTVTASSTRGKELEEDELVVVRKACQEGIKMGNDRDILLHYVSSRMSLIAPNVSAVIGTSLAAKIVGKAGGIDKLASMPSCNILLLGQLKQFSSNFLSASAVRHKGFIFECPLVQDCPSDLQTKACRLIANKLVLAARHDYTNNDSNEYGSRLLKEITDKIEKLQEPQKCGTKKVLPAPDQTAAKKRGGKRVRKRKELLGMTEIRKRQNRMVFGSSIGEYGDSSMGLDYGSLGQEGTGQIRVLKKEQKIIKKQSFGLSGKTSGFSSTFAITPVQGLELVNPDYQKEKLKKINEKYFSHSSGFSSVIPK